MGNKPGGLAAKLTGRSGGDNNKVERDSLSAVKKDKVSAVPNTAVKNGACRLHARLSHLTLHARLSHLINVTLIPAHIPPPPFPRTPRSRRHEYYARGWCQWSRQGCW